MENKLEKGEGGSTFSPQSGRQSKIIEGSKKGWETCKGKLFKSELSRLNERKEEN